MDQVQPAVNDKRSLKDLHPVQNYFYFNVVDDTSKCKVASCGFVLKGRHSSNLCRHIERNHKKLLDELNTDLDVYRNEKKKHRLSLPKAAEFVTVKIKKEDLQNGFLELININGRPFSLFNDSGMRKILDPILGAFEESGNPVSIRRENLQRDSAKKCSNLKKRIQEEMEGILFSICIDLGSSTDSRSLLGINVQYVYNFKMTFRCLAMYVHRHSNTGLRVAVLVWNSLNEHKLKLKNMLSVTSDNGTNVLRCIKILRVFQTGAVDDYLDTDLEKIDFEILDRVVEVELARTPNTDFPIEIRCIAHTQNLCLDDAMEGRSKKLLLLYFSIYFS